MLLYLALREAAHQRLFAGVPWLRDHLLGAVKAYAEGIEVNVEGIQQRVEEQMRGIDPTNPEAMQQLLEGGMFELPDSPAQKAALERLETTLALVEGWVDEVVSQATEARMPTAVQAAGGRTPPPRRRRPRRADLRHAGRPRAAPAPAARRLHAVGLAAHPPGHRGPRRRVDAPRPAARRAADLDDPLGFREDAAAPAELSEEDFDAELRKLLDGPGLPDAPTEE